ncbi:MAG: hypothetical protein ACPHAM_01115 [Flavobacteriaceae bacterium]
MRKILQIVLLCTLFSCDQKELISEKLYVHRFVSNELVYRHSLVLTIEPKDSVIDYSYLAKDSQKNLSFRYHVNKDVLLVDGALIPSKKKFFLDDKEYKIYSHSENNSTSHPRFILFRKEYGILANVAYGADFIFMKDSIIGIRDLNIFNKILSKINE